MKRILSLFTAAALGCALTACSGPASSVPVSSGAASSGSAESSASQPEQSAPASSTSTPDSDVSAPEQSAELSNDLASLQFRCNGRVYTLLETTVNDLGLTYSNAGAEELAAPAEPWQLNYPSFYSEANAETGSVAGILVNETLNASDAPLPMGDCVVTSLGVDLTEGVDFVLPGGITRGSTPEEVEEAYGPAVRNEPTADGSGSFMQYYLMDNGNADSLVVVELEFDGNGLSTVNYYQNIQLDYWNPFTMESWQLSVVQ